MPPKTTIRPYQLVSTNGPLSRDDLSRWEYNQMSFSRQNEIWQDFLPGGAFETWTATEDDDNNGLVIIKADGTGPDPIPTKKLRASFKDFLDCLSVHCPTNFCKTVHREATSWRWIITLIKDSHNLNTKGEQFLGGNDLKLEFDDNSTYQQGFMLVRDYYIACLLPKDSEFKTKTLLANEKLSPLAELFIVEKWLQKIDPKLPGHVQRTRGHLFTTDKPTLACNQRILCDQIDTMLAELNGAGNASAASVNVGFVPSRRPGFSGGRFPLQRGLRQSGFRGQGRGPSGPRQVRPPMTSLNCQHCLDAKRYDASITHPTNRCQLFFQRPQQQQLRQAVPGFKVLLVPNQQAQAAPPQVQATQATEQDQQGAMVNHLQSMNIQGATAYEDQFQYPEYNDQSYHYQVNDDQYSGAHGYSGYQPGTLEEL